MAIPTIGSIRNTLVPTGSPSGTVGVNSQYRRTDPQVRAFTFRYQGSGSGSQTQVGFENLFITLFVNPEEFTVTEPYRVTVTQTKGGAFIDNFGEGIRTINLRGVTGYKDRDVGGRLISGQEHFLQLRSMFRTWGQKVLEEGSDKHKLFFYNWQDDDHYEVVINNFSLMRSTGRSLLYQYNIALTCIQDLQQNDKIQTVTIIEDEQFERYLSDAKLRPPLILNKIESGVYALTNIVDKLVDMSKFSSGTQAWASYIAKGAEFYDTVSSTYKTVEAVITDINDLSTDVRMYVEGASSFIRKPFELVADLATSISDVIDELCSVADVPHELIRSFRDMMCAIQALSPVSFEGYTNPSLFEGASNCGTTLGIPDAPVSIYDNSFEATAQLAAEASRTQGFSSPQEINVLKETPLVVTGVYLAEDVSRTGLNYLKGFSGNEITLTSIPTVPIVIDYKVQQDTTKNRITLEASQSVIVNDDDTLSRIATRIYGDPTDWKLIAMFNNLEYPYIVNTDFVTEVKATGTVRFYRDSAESVADVTIPLGTIIWVPAYMGTLQINFITTEEKILSIGVNYVDVTVQADQYGDIGNVAPRLITGLDDITGILKIMNISAIRGGKIYSVAKPGDILQIPKTEKSIQSVVTPSEPTFEQLFGVDIAIDKFGELGNIEETATSDMRLTNGTENLVQALKNRIATKKGFYMHHLTYGTNLPYYIGKKNVPYWQELARIDVRQACLLDPRITSIQDFSLNVDGDSISIECKAIPVNETSSVNVQLVV